MRTVFIVATVVLLCFVPTQTTSAQSGNASVGGFVQDPTQAFIPGVTVTATNTQTGVVTTAITNESGTYNIPGLLPGTYKLSAELPGFKTQVINDVQLGQGASARYNFKCDLLEWRYYESDRAVWGLGSRRRGTIPVEGLWQSAVERRLRDLLRLRLLKGPRSSMCHCRCGAEVLLHDPSDYRCEIRPDSSSESQAWKERHTRPANDRASRILELRRRAR